MMAVTMPMAMLMLMLVAVVGGVRLCRRGGCSAVAMVMGMVTRVVVMVVG